MIFEQLGIKVFRERSKSNNVTINDLSKLVIKFRDDRNWSKFHNPKDLAISLTLESSELLENFQWKSSDEAIEQNYENIKDELADVIIYGILLADKLDIDLSDSIIKKQKKTEKNIQ